MNLKLIKKDMQKVSNWSGGKTNEIYIYPEDGDYNEREFLFRLSSATVEVEKSEFTYLEGVDRYILSLDNELTITHNEDDEIKLKPFEVHNFSGEDSTKSFGKARDFNLMLKNGSKGSVSIVNLNRFKEITINKKSKGVSFECFYLPKEELMFSVNEKDGILKSGELLIIETTERDEKIKIKFKSNGVVNLINSKIIL